MRVLGQVAVTAIARGATLADKVMDDHRHECVGGVKPARPAQEARPRTAAGDRLSSNSKIRISLMALSLSSRFLGPSNEPEWVERTSIEARKRRGTNRNMISRLRLRLCARD